MSRPALAKHYERPESLKKALEKAATEKAINSAHSMGSALAAMNKKPFIKSIGGKKK